MEIRDQIVRVGSSGGCIDITSLKSQRTVVDTSKTGTSLFVYGIPVKKSNRGKIARDTRVDGHRDHHEVSTTTFPFPSFATFLLFSPINQMATFSDGLSHSNALDFPLHSSSSVDMRQHLQNLVDGKEKQLQQAGALGERLLAQRVELEERVRLLQEMDADKTDEITADMRERYRELADAVRAWDFGNIQLTSAFTSSVRILFFLFFLSICRDVYRPFYLFLRPLVFPRSD
jgi:hypothetical protein